jgi:hypothetical protein
MAHRSFPPLFGSADNNNSQHALQCDPPKEKEAMTSPKLNRRSGGRKEPAKVHIAWLLDQLSELLKRFLAEADSCPMYTTRFRPSFPFSSSFLFASLQFLFFCVSSYCWPFTF